MILPPGIHQFKAFAKFLGEACRIVAVDGQPAALLRAVDGNVPMTTWPPGLSACVMRAT